MKNRVFLFDIDGTLVDTRGAGQKALIRAFEELFGWKVAFRPDQLSGYTDPMIIRRVIMNHTLDPQFYLNRKQEIFSWYAELLTEEMKNGEGGPLPGFPPLLDALKKVPNSWMGLLTGNLRKGAEIKLGAYGLMGYFPFGGFGSDAEERVSIYKSAMLTFPKPLRDSDPEIFVIGDTPHDVAVGHEMRVKSVAVATGIYDRKQLEATRPDHLFDDFSDADRFMTELSLS